MSFVSRWSERKKSERRLTSDSQRPSRAEHKDLSNPEEEDSGRLEVRVIRDSLRLSSKGVLVAAEAKQQREGGQPAAKGARREDGKGTHRPSRRKPKATMVTAMR